MSIKLSKWLNGFRAAALITLDDLCPVSEPGLDYGGDMTDSGVIESVLTGKIIKEFPFVKINMFTMANTMFNLANPFDPYRDGAYALSNNTEWTAWLKQKMLDYPQLTIAYHGWIHWWPNTGRPDEFSSYGSREDNYAALEKMEGEFTKAGLEPDKAFRPPGWGINPWLLDWLSEKNVVLGDNPRMITATDNCHPSWYETETGKKLLRIPVPDTMSIDEVIDSRGSYIMHFHFTEPNANSISRPDVLEDMLNRIRYIQDNWGNEIGWMSYGEMGEHYKITKNVRYKIKRQGSNTNIVTRNTRDELTGVTFEFTNEEPSSVYILDKSKQKVPFEVIKIGDRNCLIVNG